MIRSARNQMRLTPTEVAKIIVALAARASWEDWEDTLGIVDMDALTESERDRIDDAVRKQMRRVDKLLGYDDILW